MGLQVNVRDSVYPPGTDAGTILYDQLQSSPRYKVWIYLEGPDLPYVRSATYRLHPTFPDPIRTVTRTVSNPTCALEIWTWGLFEIHVEIEDKSGARQALEYRLNYDRQLKKDARYEQVSS
jgi:transcription initiation factor IIF auxiliary subunit